MQYCEKGGGAVWRRRGCLEEAGLSGGGGAVWRRGCLEDCLEEAGLSGGGGARRRGCLEEAGLPGGGGLDFIKIILFLYFNIFCLFL